MKLAWMAEDIASARRATSFLVALLVGSMLVNLVLALFAVRLSGHEPHWHQWRIWQPLHHHHRQHIQPHWVLVLRDCRYVRGYLILVRKQNWDERMPGK